MRLPRSIRYAQFVIDLRLVHRLQNRQIEKPLPVRQKLRPEWKAMTLALRSNHQLRFSAASVRAIDSGLVDRILRVKNVVAVPGGCAFGAGFANDSRRPALHTDRLQLAIGEVGDGSAVIGPADGEGILRERPHSA